MLLFLMLWRLLLFMVLLSVGGFVHVEQACHVRGCRLVSGWVVVGFLVVQPCCRGGWKVLVVMAEKRSWVHSDVIRTAVLFVRHCRGCRCSGVALDVL